MARVEGNSFYVALGSSFAAGPGLGRRTSGSPIISQRSVNGYPEQLARLLEVPSFTNMTSSGSTVRQVLQGGQMMLGPQIEAVGPDTRLVTLTAGGNDVGYIGDMTAMAYRNRGGLIGAAVGLFRKRARTADERDFAGLRSSLRALLLDIARRAPDARIVVVTYPALIPPGRTCAALGLTGEQAELMRSVGDRLADVTRDVAAAAGATIVDMDLLSSGHDACSDEPWVNGFKPSHGVSFHPNLAGAKATAVAIASRIQDA